jgi:hypothetical protein
MVGFPFFFLISAFYREKDGNKSKKSRPCNKLLGREKTSRGATRLDVKTHPLFAY